MLLNRAGNTVMKGGGGTGSLELPPDPYVGRLYYKPDGSKYEDAKEVFETKDFFFVARYDTNGSVYAEDITTDAQGNVYYVNSNGYVTKLTPNLEKICQITTSYSTYRIRVDDEGYIYLSPRDNGTYDLRKYTPDGEIVWGVQVNPYCTLLEMDRGNRVLYAKGMGKLMKIDFDGTILFDNYEQTDHSRGIEAFRINEDGGISYTSSANPNAIYTYSAENEKVSMLGGLATINAFECYEDKLIISSLAAFYLYTKTGELLCYGNHSSSNNVRTKRIHVANSNTFSFIGTSPYLGKVTITQNETGKYIYEMLVDGYTYYSGMYTIGSSCLHENILYIFDTARNASYRVHKILLNCKHILVDNTTPPPIL